MERELERILTERESLERMCSKGIRVAARAVDRKTLHDSLPSSSGSDGVMHLSSIGRTGTRDDSA